jgi:tRNA dimethylallyltransferase
MKPQAQIPVVMIVGPTSSGKTDFSLWLSQHFNCEIISADSRQVYKEIEIGTNKIPNRIPAIYRQEYSTFINTKTTDYNVSFLEDKANLLSMINKWIKTNVGISANTYHSAVLPHYLVDILSITEKYNLGDFIKNCFRISSKVINSNKLPIIVGGSGQYIKALIGGWEGVLMNTEKEEIRLEKLGTQVLSCRLEKLDPKYFQTIAVNNRRRIIRALAIISKTGVPLSNTLLKHRNVWLAPLIIGIKWERDELYSRIDKNIEDRFNNGLISEVEKLVKSGINKFRIRDLGLSYKLALYVLSNTITIDEAIIKAQFAEHSLVRRQMTWFNTIHNIIWVKAKNVVKS